MNPEAYKGTRVWVNKTERQSAIHNVAVQGRSSPKVQIFSTSRVGVTKRMFYKYIYYIIYNTAGAGS